VQESKEEQKVTEEQKKADEEQKKVDDFIIGYIEGNTVTVGYRWVEHRLNKLEEAAALVGLKDTVQDLKNKIMLKVKGRIE